MAETPTRPRSSVKRITSPKHPGAIFFKRRGTLEDFVCKFYPRHEAEAERFEVAMRLDEEKGDD